MKTFRFRKNATFPLQLVLVVPFVLQVFGAVALVGYLSFRNGQKAVNDLATQWMDRTSDVVDEHLKAYLSAPQKLNQINADAIRRGLLDVSDRETVGKYFWDQMQAYNLTYIGIGLTTGEGIGAARYNGKTISIDDWTASAPNNTTTYATDAWGNRTQIEARWDWDNFNEPWYTRPIAAGKPIWTTVTGNYPSGPYVAAAASRPIYDAQNRLLGMIACDIHLSKLSDYLRDLDITETGQIFIMEREGLLVADSSPEQPFAVVNQQVERLSVIDSADPVVQSIVKHFQQDPNGLRTIESHIHFRLQIKGEPHFVDVTPWRDAYGLDWLMVVSVPESAFMSQINANTQMTIALCFGALVVSSVLGLFTSRWIIQPILRLNQVSKDMASGDLNQRIEPSRIDELNTLSHSFNHMAEQLHQSFAALEQSKDELEDRVEQRTIALKETLEELQRTQSQVIQSEKMSSLGQLVAGIAHEINNPVNFIHGNLAHVQGYVQDLLTFMQLCQRYYPNPKPEIQVAAAEIDLEFLREDLPKVLTSMKLGTDRIRQIVLSLRNFSRMEEAEFKAVDIHEGIDSTLMILQHRLKAKPERPEIELIKDYGTLPLVECYPGQLNQVFMNILANAIDALEENSARCTYQEMQNHPSCITIRTAVIGGSLTGHGSNNDASSDASHNASASWIEVTIGDNGPGMPQTVQQRIFDPFFTTKPIGKGTGMGMSISYQIITEKHGGKLECCSTMGKGTEFIIRLPQRQLVHPVI